MLIELPELEANFVQVLKNSLVILIIFLSSKLKSSVMTKVTLADT